jgi:hypothetical protein
MKTTIKIQKEVEIKTLKVEANVRYWEDATVNGVADENGDLIPFRIDEMWCPVIEIDTGIIKDWPIGTVASIHYKVVDEGNYYLIDEDNNTVLSIEQDYVPSILCPKENGYGDYIIMDISENGQIADWKIDITDFGVED